MFISLRLMCPRLRNGHIHSDVDDCWAFFAAAAKTIVKKKEIYNAIALDRSIADLFQASSISLSLSLSLLLSFAF